MFTHSYSVEEISSIIADKAIIRLPQQMILHLATDSRKITEPQASIFFILKGNRDAHQFIPNLYAQGLRSFVITDAEFDIQAYPEANFLFVEDSLQALQKLATYHRALFNYPVIGITGSNGKTIVKEWLFQLLVPDYKLVRSPKSYNSQIGVPLSVWQMNEHYDFALLEAGISTKGEMKRLANIIKPNIGILTNIAAAHDEGFKNREEKLNEKLQLFKGCKTVIINKKYQNDSLKGKEIFTWSVTETADLQVNKIEYIGQETLIKAIYQNENIDIQIPFNNQASVENAIICWATLLQLGLSPLLIKQRMSKLLAVKMRLELKSGINLSSIIDDSYNSDFSSLAIALDFLNQQNQHPKKTIILSDIHQTGINPDDLYKNLAQLLQSKGIDRLIAIGPDLYQYQQLFNWNSLFFKDTEDFLKHFDQNQIQNETVLIKGARHFGFERISQALTQKVHDTVLEINLNALNYNLNHYKAKLKPNVKVMAMVKAFAYGSGSQEVANLLQYNKVDYLAVAYADEGIALRQAGINLPIMVLSPEVSSFEAIVQYDLEPEIYSFRILKAFADFCSQKKLKNYPIHIKLDTGMHRLGFTADDTQQLIAHLKGSEQIKIYSVLSHLAASESDIHEIYTQSQITIFEEITAAIEANLNYSFIRHIANTSAITKWPKSQFEMVRLGIGLYGIESLKSERNALQNVATLKTSISQIKYLKKGDTIGYGRTGLMPNDGKIATVKIGYADGYPRALGNGVGKMLINGSLVPTIGNICMDMCMLDISGLEVSEADDVIVFGEELSVYELANSLSTIPYEVITNISQRVKRVYFYE